MSIPLTVNGSTFQYPQTGNSQWGPAATAWASAVTTGMLQKAGGLFTLTQEVDFGANHGLKSLYYKSRSSNISESGFVRGSNTDLITWRNGANNGDNTLGVSPSNVLLYNGNPIGGSVAVENTPTINLDFTNDTLTANIVDNSITNILINESAAIAVSKLAAGTTTQILLTNGSTPTWTTISGDGYNSATGVFTTTGLRGKPLSTTLASLGAAQDGYTLTWNNTGNQWMATPGSAGVGQLAGDVTGPSDNNRVREITGLSGAALVKCNNLTFDGYITNPTINQLGIGGGGGGGGNGDLTIEGGVLKISGGPNVVLHCLEIMYNVDEYNFGAAELCQLAIDLGFNSISPLVGNTYGTVEIMQELGDAALAAGLIIGFNGDHTSDGRAWLTNPAFIEYTNSLPNCFVRLEIEFDLSGDFAPDSEYIDKCLSLVNEYRAAGGTRIIQVGAPQGGRMVQYPLSAGLAVCAADPLQKTMLGWQVYWCGDPTDTSFYGPNFYQNLAGYPPGVTGTLQALNDYHDLAAAKCCGIDWEDNIGLTEAEQLIERCLENNQSFMWWVLLRDGMRPLNNLVENDIYNLPVELTATGEAVSALLIPSLHLYYPGGVPEGGGGGGGGLTNGSNLTIIAQTGTDNGGDLLLKGGDGYVEDGSVSIFNGPSEINTTFLPNVAKHFVGQADNTHIVVDDYTLLQSDTVIGLENLTNNITLTLLPSADLQLGTRYVIKDLDGSLATYTVTIDAPGSDTINGASTYVMNVADSSIIISLIDTDRWFTVGGSGAGDVQVSNEDHIFLTDSSQVGFQKNSHKQFIFEDFEVCTNTTLTATGSSGYKTLVHFANTNWLGGSYITDGRVAPRVSVQGHPGVVRLASGDSDSGAQVSWINMGDFNEGGYFFPYHVGDIYELEAAFKANETENSQFLFGLANEVKLAEITDAVAFFKDTTDDVTAHALCRNDGYSTDSDTNYNPDTNWTKYTIRQTTPGTFTFYINEVLKNTISTNIPSNKILSPFFTIQTTNSGGSSKSMDIDYFHLITRDLGSRFDAPAGDIAFVSTDSGAGPTIGYTIAAGSNRLLVVSAYSDFGEGVSATCTFDGYAMSVATNSNPYVQIFYMFNPPVGTYSINTSYEFGVNIVACQYDNVSSFQESSQGAVQSFNYTIGGAGLLVCSAYGGGGTSAPLSDCTERYDDGGRAYNDSIRSAGGTFTVGGSGLTEVDGAGAVFLGFS